MIILTSEPKPYIKEPWELDGINLDISSYPQDVTDAIIIMKRDIKRRLSSKTLPVTNLQRYAYSAEFQALDAYAKLQFMPSKENEGDIPFIEHKLNQVNRDCIKLNTLFPADSPDDPQTVEFYGRIKSPISALTKIREKISEYMRNINTQNLIKMKMKKGSLSLSEIKTYLSQEGFDSEEIAKELSKLKEYIEDPTSKKDDFGKLLNLRVVAELTKNKEFTQNDLDAYYDKYGEWDFRDFGESIRDFFGIKVIVTPPKSVKAQGPEAEKSYLDRIYNTYMNDSFKKENLIPLNSKRHPHKQEEVETSSFIPEEHPCIYVSQNPTQIDSELIPYTKRYDEFPKRSGYQSKHICVTSTFPFITTHEDPAIIVEPNNQSYGTSYNYEIQFVLDTYEHNNEHEAAHDKYKPTEKNNFNKHSVPMYFGPDARTRSPKLAPITINCPRLDSNGVIISSYRRPISTTRLYNFGEEVEKFYGYSFQDLFGITFEEFSNADQLTTQDRDDILNRRKTAIKDENGIIDFINMPVLIFLSKEDRNNPEVPKVINRYKQAGIRYEIRFLNLPEDLKVTIDSAIPITTAPPTINAVLPSTMAKQSPSPKPAGIRELIKKAKKFLPGPFDDDGMR